MRSPDGVEQIVVVFIGFLIIVEHEQRLGWCTENAVPRGWRIR